MSGKNLAKSLFLLAILFQALLVNTPNSNAGGTLAGVKICLDPGHGGTDPGAVNAAYDLKESDINLDVSYGLKSLLESESAEVVMTRTGDEYLTNSDRYNYCNNQEAAILISVHTNSVTDPSWDGSMALYGPRESPELAQTIYDVMYPFLGGSAPGGVTEFIDFGVDKFASGVLFKSTMPAAMMEPVLMSHPAEAELLVTPIYSDETFNSAECSDFSCRRGQIAQAIFLGTRSYFNGPSNGTMHVDSIDLSYEQKRSNYTIEALVVVQDDSLQPVPAYGVTLEITYPDGTRKLDTAVAGEDGTAVIRFKTRTIGTYYVEIVDVTKTNWSYDPDANVEDSDYLTIP
ncbi:MAG: N-acetylmuramoyl-L-alanine amidase [Candidatus Promineifilaceae bacterium]